MASFLGPLLGLAAGGIGSLFGGANPLSGQLPGVPQASQAILGNTGSQLSTGNNAVGGGLDLLKSAGDFYKNILGGSLEDTQKLLGPQVSTVMKQYDSAAKSAANLGPRGGGKAGVLASAQTGKAGAYGDLLSKALPGAAQGEAGVGSAQAGVGTSLLGQENALEGSVIGEQGRAASQNAQALGGLGSGLGKWLASKL